VLAAVQPESLHALPGSVPILLAWQQARALSICLVSATAAFSVNSPLLVILSNSSPPVYS
jgi:hypothetical protein